MFFLATFSIVVIIAFLHHFSVDLTSMGPMLSQIIVTLLPLLNALPRKVAEIFSYLIVENRWVGLKPNLPPWGAYLRTVIDTACIDELARNLGYPKIYHPARSIASCRSTRDLSGSHTDAIYPCWGVNRSKNHPTRKATPCPMSILLVMM